MGVNNSVIPYGSLEMNNYFCPNHITEPLFDFIEIRVLGVDFSLWQSGGQTDGRRKMLNLKITYRSFANVLTTEEYSCCQGFGPCLLCIVCIIPNFKPQICRQ
jgi:hypothetical protein